MRSKQQLIYLFGGQSLETASSLSGGMTGVQSTGQFLVGLMPDAPDARFTRCIFGDDLGGVASWEQSSTMISSQLRYCARQSRIASRK